MNTVFLRLEGFLQSWGYSSNFVYRHSGEEPSKSGIVGLLCSCLGLNRQAANKEIQTLNQLRMAVRVDRKGSKITDYQTIDVNGASFHSDKDIPRNGKPTEEVVREYICDASYLVAIQGNTSIINRLSIALQNPVFQPYLGRKCCVPCREIFEGIQNFSCPEQLEVAMQAYPWRPRSAAEIYPDFCECVVDSTEGGEIRRDVLLSLLPHTLGNRLVKHFNVSPPLGEVIYPKDIKEDRKPKNAKKWEEKRKARLIKDDGLCVICSLPATEVHHVSYERVPDEDVEKDLRSLCTLCHEIISAIEYETNMGTNRLDPLDEYVRRLVFARLCSPQWRSSPKE